MNDKSERYKKKKHLGQRSKDDLQFCIYNRQSPATSLLLSRDKTPVMSNNSKYIAKIPALSNHAQCKFNSFQEFFVALN